MSQTASNLDVATRSDSAGALGDQARRVLPAVRSALAEVLAATSPPIRRPRDLCRAFGLSQPLAWRIVRTAYGPDIFADAQHIPGAAGIESFLNGAERHGVPQPLIARARHAFLDFERLIAAHAGDRASLEMMLAGLSGADTPQPESRTARRAAFRCASATWGVQVRTRVLSKILHPSDEPGLMDIAMVRGFVGVRRIRPGAPLTLARVVVLDNDGQERRRPTPEPLDPDGLTSGVPLLRRYCSEPLPEIRIAPGPDGVPEQQLGETPVGESAAVTVFAGEVVRRAAGRYRDEHNTHSNTAVSIRTPIQTLVIDVFAHRDIFPPADRPRALLYGELCGTPWYRQRPEAAESLPLAESVQTLGRGLTHADLDEAPEYATVMADVLARLGWKPEAFTHHRLRVEFPVIATALVMQMDLPPARG